MTSPSSILLAAADRIRDLAAAATPGEWSIKANEDRKGNHVHSTFTLPPLPGSNLPRDRMVRPSEAADYAWAAAMSPAVAPALERILRDAAKDWVNFSKIYTPEAMEAQKSYRRFAGAFALAAALAPELVEEDQK